MGRTLYGTQKPAKYTKVPRCLKIARLKCTTIIRNNGTKNCPVITQEEFVVVSSSHDHNHQQVEPLLHDDSSNIITNQLGYDYHFLDLPPVDSEDDDEEEAPTPAPQSAALAMTNRTGSLLSINETAMVEIIQLCNRAGTPIGFVDSLIQLMKKNTMNGFNIAKAPSRATLLNRLRAKYPSVQAKRVLTAFGDAIPKFSFLDQLIGLFSSEYFKSPSSCCVNADEGLRFLQYQPGPGEGISEVLGAEWYKLTYQSKIGSCPMHVDPTTNCEYHNWLVPIIFYNDKTGVSAMEGSYTLEPLMFTLGVIKRSLREKANAWRHLGFIPCRSASKGSGSAEECLSFTHECMKVLLADLVELQENPPLLSLNLFGEKKECKVRVLLEVAFVIGDQLSQDTHCCRKKINGGGAGRMHRSCMTSFLHAASTPPLGGCTPVSKSVLDDLCAIIHRSENDVQRQVFLEAYPLFNKKKMEQALKIRSQVAREILEKSFSLYPVHNAWSAISFGSNINGIHRATLDDPMHYNSSGLFKYLSEVAFKGLLPSESKELELHMRKDFTKRSSVRYDLPRGKFSPGFTNCTLLTASENVGLMYALYLSLDTPRVSSLFEKSILRQQIKYVDQPSSCSSSSSGCSTTGSRREGPNISYHPTFPRIGDKYFFKKPSSQDVMPRDLRGIKMMVKDLNRFGILALVAPALASFDSLQTEYLLHATWTRVTKKIKVLLPGTAAAVTLSRALAQVDPRLEKNATDQISRDLFSKLRQPAEKAALTNDRSSKNRTTLLSPAVFVEIQDQITKHHFDKPKVLGRGNTSAILTNVDGFRKVLELALIFYAIVHEYHHLEPDLQIEFHRLKEKLDMLLEIIFSSIYRGDNSVDVGTCKCHSHFHLPWDIQYYGAPMGFDASKGERNLKSWAKHVSKTAQKCGEAHFIQQTAQRVSDHLLIDTAQSDIDQHTKATTMTAAATAHHENSITATPKWKYTRRTCHLLYNLSTGDTTLDCKVYIKSSGCEKLLTDQIQRVLHETHGHQGNIMIWKEILLNLGIGEGEHRVRASHDFDIHGPFFDWVQLKKVQQNNDMDYRPAKVLLLYQVEGEDFALVWQARTATPAERRRETNLSARWKMDLQKDGLPSVTSVPTNLIERCIFVYEHWRCLNNNHLPSTPYSDDGDGLPRDTNTFVIDEVYERYSWAHNFLQDSQWCDEEE